MRQARARSFPLDRLKNPRRWRPVRPHVLHPCPGVILDAQPQVCTPSLCAVCGASVVQPQPIPARAAFRLTCPGLHSSSTIRTRIGSVPYRNPLPSPVPCSPAHTPPARLRGRRGFACLGPPWLDADEPLNQGSQGARAPNHPVNSPIGPPLPPLPPTATTAPAATLPSRAPPPRSRKPAPECDSLVTGTLLFQIGKPKQLMNWNAAGLNVAPIY